MKKTTTTKAQRVDANAGAGTALWGTHPEGEQSPTSEMNTDAVAIAALQAWREEQVAASLADVEAAARAYVEALADGVAETLAWMGAIPVAALIAYVERFTPAVQHARRTRNDLETRYVNHALLLWQLEYPSDAPQATESDETPT